MSAIQLYKRILQGIGVVPKVSSENAVLGDLEVLSTSNRLMFYGVSNDAVTTDGVIATLTNKTIDAGSNTVSNLTNDNLSGDAEITNDNLATMPALTLKGNNSGSTNGPFDLDVAGVNLILPVFTSSLNGLVPLSGGGTTNFLRADGSWAAAGGGGSVTAVSVASANGFAGSSSGGSTPVLTLSTTVTGILKGNGTTISAATSGTDYAPAGNYITALTGDGTASGPNSAALTLATVNSNIGTWNNVTVNAKGLVTAGSNASYLTGNQTITLSGDVTGSGTTAITATIAANAVTNAKAAQMVTLTIKGNNTGGTANASDLTVAQVNAILPVFTSSLNGLVPLSGGGTTNFLRADGTWAAAGGGTGTVTSVAMTVPSFLSIAGSPITSSGTLTVTLSGTALPVANGGTGQTSLTNHGVLIGAGTSGITQLSVAGAGTLLSGQPSADPSFTASPVLGVNATTPGTLGFANGGTLGTTVTVQNLGATTAYNFNLPTTAGISGQVLASAGGTTNSMTWASTLTNPMTTGGDIIYGGTSGSPTRLANGTVNQYLASSGGTTAPVWTSFVAPTIQKFTSTGSTTGYIFVVSSANATSGATYTNNGNTYTVLSTISAGTLLYTSQASAPQASGTLTKSSGTGDATITFSSAVAAGTYTPPSSPRAPLYLKVRMVGAGGGGSGSGSLSSAGAGGAGGFSAFGPSLLLANGGSGGTAASPSSGGTGGTAQLGTGPIGIALQGGNGSGGNYNGATVSSVVGGGGAASPFGGAGGGAGINATAGTAITNTGSGGGGGSVTDGTSGKAGGAGGGAGGYVDAIITSASSTYIYTIGSAGSSGTGGTGGEGGAAGGSGLIIVEEHYQ